MAATAAPSSSPTRAFPRVFPRVDDQAMIDRAKMASVMRRARKDAGLSMDEAAELFGICAEKWRRWETGAQSIPAELLGRIAKIVRTTPSKILKAA